ncbi:MAG: hypothetical protein AB1938_02945 [Myxococcota bacterium]
MAQAAVKTMEAAPSEPAGGPLNVARVAVTVRMKDEAQHATVLAPSGEKCATPCTLSLAPGPNLLTFEGDASGVGWVEVPAAGGTLQVAFASRGRRTAAWVLGGLGFLVIGVGAALAPVLGGVPLLIMAGAGLALFLPGLILGLTNKDSFEWLEAPSS